MSPYNLLDFIRPMVEKKVHIEHLHLEDLQKNDASRLQRYLKKRLWHMCFTMSFAKILRTPFL